MPASQRTACSPSVPRRSTRVTPVNSSRGSGVKRCKECLRAQRDTKETIHCGLLLIRVRYGLPYCELPECSPSDLGRFLSFLLLQGKERDPVAFPRKQLRDELTGLCRLQRLCRRDRWELAHSVASIKRNLPAGCRRHTPSMRSEWCANAFSTPPPSSPEYLAFAKRVVSQIFTPGWDRSYGSFVGSHLPNPSARRNPFCPAHVAWEGRRGEFFTKCMKEALLPSSFKARYKEVLSAGKIRPLLIFDENIDLLAPLHKMIYSHLRRRTDWLLCGPPTVERMTSVCAGKYQTSVDLVSATDGLCHDVAKTILDAMFFTSVKVPRSVRALAHASLTPGVFTLGGEDLGRVSHGQMMGSYLSFPLLCLQSYVAARWAARFDPSARFLVNGDDTVISASREVTANLYPPGFRLNDTKTIRAENVVEINSTAFLRSRGKWRLVRHLRRGGATTDYVGMLHMAEAVKVSQPFEIAYQRARIGRHWGFLPSQLGHTSYPAFRRERGLSLRNFTRLPEPPLLRGEGLVACRGEASPVEAEALRSYLWDRAHARGGKRDVFNPSVGKIRRTYAYSTSVCKYRLSYVYWAGKRDPPARKKDQIYFLPEDFISEEEEKALAELDNFRELFSASGT